jgi:glycosyltransferase involved in cell wall biosynthesis
MRADADNASPGRADPARRVLILEPDLDGHHAFWLALLVEAHRRAGRAVEVLTVPDVSRLRAQAELRGFGLDGVRLHEAREAGEAGLLRQAREIAAATGAGRILVPFLDRYWPAILDEADETTGEGRVKLSGIWFHPHALDAGWRWAPPWGKRWRVRGRVHRFLRSARAAEVLDSLCFLVDEPVFRMREINPSVRGHLLPDPYEREPRLGREEARRLLGLPEDRTVFLHLGSAERRKGLPDVLAAFAELVRRSDLAPGRPPLLLRVGPNDRLRPAERALLDDLAARGRASVVDGFVPADLLMEYFAACDWVLVPYRKFRYSSGIVANAAGALRPVIAADHGQIGREVARDGLGMLYAHGSSAALAGALAKALAESGAAEEFNEGLKTARRFRTVEAMLSSLADYLAADGAKSIP